MVAIGRGKTKGIVLRYSAKCKYCSDTIDVAAHPTQIKFCSKDCLQKFKEKKK